ncbi:hypothetical protein F2P56_037230 [Juglans regia]|uniref:Uncharacterized protein n=1 Tax=Juglans regia TaxID=51240 RepID=A0A833TS36_JUGRE|nr:hypothetical protein F2P56_037230 [Juglans regia]
MAQHQAWQKLIGNEGLEAVQPIHLRCETRCPLLRSDLFLSTRRWWLCISLLLLARIDASGGGGVTIALGNRREGGPHRLAQQLGTHGVEGTKHGIHDFCL